MYTVIEAYNNGRNELITKWDLRRPFDHSSQVETKVYFTCSPLDRRF